MTHRIHPNAPKTIEQAADEWCQNVADDYYAAMKRAAFPPIPQGPLYDKEAIDREKVYQTTRWKRSVSLEEMHNLRLEVPNGEDSADFINRTRGVK